MGRLIRLSLLLIVAASLLVVVAKAIGRMSLPPAATSVLTEACAAPCWHDIQPGKTTIDEAEALLQADHTTLIANVYRLQTQQFAYTDHQLCWDIQGRPPWQGCAAASALPVKGGPVTRLDFDLVLDSNPPFQLGDAIVKFGQPQVALLCSRLGFVYTRIFFPNNVEVRAINQRDQLRLELTPNMSVYSVRYYYPSDEPPYPFDAPPWRGFLIDTSETGC